jgi:hypothetical protein
VQDKIKQMTWLDLYSFLNERANNINAVGTFEWNKPVMVFDNATGELFNCETYYSDSEEDGLVLIINHSKDN